MITADLTQYLIFGVLLILCFFAYAIGTEKMIKIIIGNYLLSTICLAGSVVIDMVINMYTQLGNQVALFGLTYSQIGNFISTGRTTVIILLYVFLLILVFSKSRLTISLSEHESKSILVRIALLPLTVLSALLTLEIALLGTTVLNITLLQTVAKEFLNVPYIYFFIARSPLWFFLHGIITVMLTSQMRTKPQAVNDFGDN